jgi:hypothetical protein
MIPTWSGELRKSARSEVDGFTVLLKTGDESKNQFTGTSTNKYAAAQYGEAAKIAQRHEMRGGIPSNLSEGFLGVKQKTGVKEVNKYQAAYRKKREEGKLTFFSKGLRWYETELTNKPENLKALREIIIDYMRKI